MAFVRYFRCLVLVVGVFYAGLLQAKERILVIEPQGSFLSKPLQDAANKTLRSLGADYTDLEILKESSLLKLQAQAGCKNVTINCLRKIGRVAGANKVLSTQAKRLPGRRILVMKLVNSASGKLVKQSRQRLPKGKRALSRALKKGWVSLFGKIVKCRILVNANIDNAKVLLDGKQKGTTPLIIEGKFKVGRHTLTVLHRDTLPSVRRIVIKSGRKNLRYKFHLKLKPEDDYFPLVPLVKHKVKLGAKGNAEKPGKGLKTGTAGVGDTSGPGKGLKTGTAGVGDTSGPGKGLKTGTVSHGSTGEPYIPSVQKQPQPEKTSADENTAHPVYKTWWFWTAVGVVVAAGAVTGAVIGLSGDDNSIPSGMGRLTIQF